MDGFDSKYSRYVSTINKYAPDAGARHQAVVARLRQIAAGCRGNPDPIGRMECQIEGNRGLKGITKGVVPAARGF
jgi:hypothetical protein